MSTISEKDEKKGSKFDEFVDKHFGLRKDFDFGDPFDIINLLVYGILKLMSKTRNKYKEWKTEAKKTKPARQKLDEIRKSRERNWKKAKDYDELSPELKDIAEQMAMQKVAKDKSLKGKEEELMRQMGKELHFQSLEAREGNPWVDQWKEKAEQEMRDQLEGKPVQNSVQYSEAAYRNIMSPQWIQYQTQKHLNKYVNEAITKDPSLEEHRQEVRENFRTAATIQAYRDQTLVRELYFWQNHKQSELEAEKERELEESKEDELQNETQNESRIQNENQNENQTQNSNENQNESRNENQNELDDSMQALNGSREEFNPIQPQEDNLQGENVNIPDQFNPEDIIRGGEMDQDFEADDNDMLNELDNRDPSLTTSENLNNAFMNESSRQNPFGMGRGANTGNQNQIQAPVQEGQVPAQWWTPRQVEQFLNNNLRPNQSPNHRESQEFVEFRDSMQNLYNKMREKPDDMLSQEYTDLYNKAQKYDEYYNNHRDTEPRERGDLSNHVINELQKNARIEKYQQLSVHEKNLAMQDMAKQTGAINNGHQVLQSQDQKEMQAQKDLQKEKEKERQAQREKNLERERQKERQHQMERERSRTMLRRSQNVLDKQNNMNMSMGSM